MDKYLKLILQEINTIIIPELGALTITNPSSGKVMFMPYLKYDDGKLATFISEKEGIDLADAKNKIAKQVREINAKLDQGEAYDIFEFGSFSKSTDEIIFTNWEEVGNASDQPKDAAAVEPIKETEEEAVETPEPVVETPVIEEPVVETPEPEEPVIEEPVVETPEPETPVNTEEENTPTEEEEEEIKLVITPVDFGDEKPIPEEELAAQLKAEQEQLDKEAAEKSAKKEQKKKPVKEKVVKEKVEKEPASPEKKKRRKWIIIIIASLIAIGAIGAFICMNIHHDKHETDNGHGTTTHEDHDSHQDHDEAHDTAAENDEHSDNELNSEDEHTSTHDEGTEGTENHEAEQEKVVVEKVAPMQHSTSEAISGAYYIILNAFSEIDNANNFVDLLKNKGKQAVNLGKADQLYLVGVGPFNSRAEAVSNLGNEKTDAPTAWLYQKK